MVVILNLYESDGGRGFDCSPVIDADGTLLGRTRMIHITDYACFHEQGYYAPGDTGAPVYHTRAGAIGVAICYDRHFPEYMRALALDGADLVVVPQAGAIDEWPEGLYEAEMQVAAFQNGYYVALCNRVGEEDCLTFAGESFVCRAGRSGDRPRTASSRRRRLYADVDLVAAVASSHARRLFLDHRRPELYAAWVAPADDHVADPAAGLAAGLRLLVSPLASALTADSGHYHRLRDEAEARAGGGVDADGYPPGSSRRRPRPRAAHDRESRRRWGLFNFAPEDADALRAMLKPREIVRSQGLRRIPAGSNGGRSCCAALDAEQIKSAGLHAYRSEGRRARCDRELEAGTSVLLEVIRLRRCFHAAAPSANTDRDRNGASDEARASEGSLEPIS